MAEEISQIQDSGLFSLTLILRFVDRAVDVQQIRACCGSGPVVGVPEMVKAASRMGFKARTSRPKWSRLSKAPLPGIVALRNGKFLILGKVAEDRVLIQQPGESRPEVISRTRFESLWDGRVVLFARRGKWSTAIRSGIRRLTELPHQSARILGAVCRRATNLSGGIGKSLVGNVAHGGRLRKLIDRASSSFPQLFADWRDVPAVDNVENATSGVAPSDGSGLEALVLLLRIHNVAADAEQIRHRCASAAIGVNEMLRCAKEFGLKACASVTDWERLASTPLPGIAALRDGGFVILGKAVEDKILIQYPSSSRPEALSREQFESIWDGRLVLMTRRAILSDLSRRFDITWFLGAIHKYRYLLIEVLVASFFLQLFALVSPLFFQVVIDKVLVHRSMSTLDVLVIGLVGISLFEAILGTLRTYLFAHTTNRIDVELGARLFRHLLALPIAYFQARRVGDSVARVRELENVRQFITSSALTLVIDLCFTFVFLAVMLYYSPKLTFVVLLAFPLYIAISVGATPAFRRRLDEKFRRGAENQAFLVESVTGIETLKAMAVEPQMQRKWEVQLAGYVAASFRVITLNNTASQAVQLINKVTVVLILYFGAKLVIGGSLSVGELVAFNMLASHVSTPVLRLAQMWQDFHQARLSVARLGDILNSTAESSYSPGRVALPAIRGAVSFEHVSFRYRVDGSEILHDVSFSALPGQVVGIVGSSGSGKSTLAKLIQRLYVPESGRVMIDGADLMMVDLAWLRRQIGVVLQENVLFNCSVRDNIALADPATPIDQVIAAAKLAGAHEFVLELPNGYDTVIGERGSSLSGGQRQRLAIARALLLNPRILILDEATSALDYESERVIQQNMREIAAGRTVFIIAHRLSTVRHADRIITVERGRIVEDGSHDQLIRSNGRYAKLHYLQAGIQ
jgi:ATP-binding cassette, subfamily B, bacterial HlyB/CyaB